MAVQVAVNAVMCNLKLVKPEVFAFQNPTALIEATAVGAEVPVAIG